MARRYSVKFKGDLKFTGTGAECSDFLGRTFQNDHVIGFWSKALGIEAVEAIVGTGAMAGWVVSQEDLCRTCYGSLSRVEKADGECIRCQTFVALGMEKYVRTSIPSEHVN